MNKAMLAAIHMLSYPEIDIRKTYPLERELKKLMAHRHKNPALCRIWERAVPCGTHEVPVRIFTPIEVTRPFILLFFHGGGWVLGDIDSYDGVCRDMAVTTGCIVASADYRLAPEHPFPAAPEDCYAVAKALFQNCGVFGVDPSDIVLIGDSAGGNLAASVSLMARDRGEFLPGRQILIYPSTGNDHSDTSPYPSIRENGTGYLLTSKRICDYLDMYRTSDDDLLNPYFAPLMAGDFSNQPDTLLITAQYCPLRDEGEAYGQKLLEAGGRVEVHRMENALHGYFTLPVRFELVKKTYALINHFLEE